MPDNFTSITARVLVRAEELGDLQYMQRVKTMNAEPTLSEINQDLQKLERLCQKKISSSTVLIKMSGKLYELSQAFHYLELLGKPQHVGMPSDLGLIKNKLEYFIPSSFIASISWSMLTLWSKALENREQLGVKPLVEVIIDFNSMFSDIRGPQLLWILENHPPAKGG